MKYLNLEFLGAKASRTNVHFLLEKITSSVCLFVVFLFCLYFYIFFTASSNCCVRVAGGAAEAAAA